MMMTLNQLQALLPQARPFGADGTLPILRVHTDTRSLQPGDLFVALRGERFDAHDFLPQAAASGAVAALAEHGLAAAGLPGVQVADSRLALGALATAWRAQFSLPLIAVTGSNGKTTVTQMLASILHAWHGEAALATQGNFNNDIGVPLTLLRLHAGHRAAVVELGMNHPGEIAQLAAQAAPTVVLVNNAQREHQEFMASVAAVAEENGAAISALPADGWAVFPADDAHSAVWARLAGERRRLRFALDNTADNATVAAEVSGQAEWAGDHWRLQMVTPAGTAELALQVAGRHNLKNALAATACALAAGCPLEVVLRGLQAFEPVKGRSQIKTTTHQGQALTLIDDSYNANPDSVRAAIEVLAGLPGPRWLVLGDMGEVGDQGPAFHEEVGAYARACGINTLWAAGEQTAASALAFGAGAAHFSTVADLLAALPQAPLCRAAVVKGSRFMKMEQVVQALMAAGTGAAVSATATGGPTCS